MTNLTSIALSASVALGVFSGPAIANDLDTEFSIRGHLVPAQYSHRIWVCEDDDDDGGRECFYIRRGYPAPLHGYRYGDDDDDGIRWHGYDDDDGGRWHDDDD
ncbi:hypothetical protein V8J82_16365 [Gymnodinialimonas sp. 2305UL16-5]|uniref:hypothetical protein n=1 Tax=Gymnodinialimonas mytili TaxID=3126503 RepID=UPI0030AC6B0C